MGGLSSKDWEDAISRFVDTNISTPCHCGVGVDFAHDRGGCGYELASKEISATAVAGKLFSSKPFNDQK